MTPNNNLSILPFYNSISEQNHRKDYAFGEIYPLFTPSGGLLPFQIILANTVSTNTSDYGLTLYDLEGNNRGDLSQDFQTYGTITEYSSEGYTIIRYNDTGGGSGFTEGRYYLMLHDLDTDQAVYSEVFTVASNLDNCLKITYSFEEDLIFSGGRIESPIGFSWAVFLPTQLGMPEYPFTEDVEERDGYSFIEKQISEKTFKFNFIAPEYLLDAMRIIRMADSVTILNRGESYSAETFLITPTWEEGGYLASVEAEFQCDTIIKKIGVV